MHESHSTTTQGMLLAFLIFLVGGIDILFRWYAVFFVTDYVTGTMAAVARGEKLSSRKAGMGLLMKFGYFTMIIVGHGMDEIFGLGNTARNGALLVVCGIELKSIIENWVDIGLLVPSPIKKFYNAFFDEKE